MKDLELVRYKKSNKNKVVTLLFSVVLLIMVIGLSYAFFIYNKTGLYTHTINGGKMGVSYNEITGNNITIDNAYPRTDKEALTYGLEFEFTITGYNESERNVYYAIEMEHGADISGKDRFLDSDMKLSLYENNKVVFENEIFNNLDNQDIHYGHINYGTIQESPVVNTYKLRIWINDNVMITNTPDTVDTTGKNVYSSEEFANHYANFKVNVKADLTYDDVGYLTYDANGGTNTPKKTSLTTGLVTTQKPVMEGKGFLGWSGTKDGEVEFRAGDTYTGDYDVLYAVYSDTRNVMGQIPTTLTYTHYFENAGGGGELSYDLDKVQTLPLSEFLGSEEANVSGITEIQFLNDTRANIDARYNAATVKADLTYNNQGSVKAWLEEGDLAEIYINGYGDSSGENVQTYKLYIAAEGTIYFSQGQALFSRFLNTEIIDLTHVDTSMVTDMTAMFGYYWDEESGDEYFGCYSLTNLNLSSFNTSQVTNMSGMFAYASITTLDVSNWDTSNVTNMSLMFDSASLGNLDVSNWDTSNVTYMSEMFYWCSSLTSLDLSNWDTSNVTYMSEMFAHATITTLDVSSWDTSNVTNMSEMFAYATITTLDVSNWDTSNVTNMSEMFAYATITTLDVSNWDTSSVIDMSWMFRECSSLTSLDLSDWDTSKVTDMSLMFYRCTNLTSLDLSSFNTSQVTNMSSMFRGCSSLTSLDVSNFDTSKVTNMSGMFSDVSMTSLDLSSFNTSQVTNMSYMFDGCNSLTSLDVSNFDTSKVTNMAGMFYVCNGLISLDVSNFDTSKVTDMSLMFYRCTNLTSLDLSSFNTSQVTNMSYMFDGCSSLTTIYANSDWKTDTVTSSTNMFNGCTKLKGAIIYSSAKTDVTYANPDTGYFTKK